MRVTGVKKIGISLGITIHHNDFFDQILLIVQNYHRLTIHLVIPCYSSLLPFIPHQSANLSSVYIIQQQIISVFLWFSSLINSPLFATVWTLLTALFGNRLCPQLLDLKRFSNFG